MKVNPKEMVKRERVTTPTKVKRIPMTNKETNMRYFLFSQRYPEGSEVKEKEGTELGSSLCCLNILLLLLLMEAGEAEE